MLNAIPHALDSQVGCSSLEEPQSNNMGRYGATRLFSEPTLRSPPLVLLWDLFSMEEISGCPGVYITSLSLGTLRVRGTTKMISRPWDIKEACIRIHGCAHPSEATTGQFPTDMTGSPPASVLQTFGTEVCTTGFLGLGQLVKGQEYWEPARYHGCILSFCEIAPFYQPSLVCWEATACTIRQKERS